MKQIILILIILLCLGFSASGQVPDTMFVEIDTATISTPDTSYLDTFFLVAVGTKNARNDRLNISYIDAEFDSSGVRTYAFRQIKENEDKQGAADLRKMEADALTRLYGDVNNILRDFTGGGYLANARQAYGDRYTGYYRARVGNSVSFFRLRPNGTSVEVDAQGAVVVGGFSGRWNAITENRFRLVNHFPAGIVPAGTTFTRIINDRFGAPGLQIRIRKIK